MNAPNILIWLVVIFACCMLAVYLIGLMGLKEGGARTARILVGCAGLIALIYVIFGNAPVIWH